MRIALLLCSLLFTACGCIRVADAHKDGRIAGTDISHTIGKALESFDFVEGEWPSDRWWERFQDPQLAAFIDQALEQSPTLQSAQAKLEAALQVQRQRYSWFLPSLEAGFQDNWQTQGKNTFFRAFGSPYPARINQIDLRLNLFYNLDFWGKYRNAWRSAQFTAFAQNAELAQARLTLSTAVAGTYIELQNALARMALYDELIRQNEEKVALSILRVEKGLNPEMGTLEAKKQLQDTLSRREHLKQRADLLRHQLAALMGKGPDALPKVLFIRSSSIEVMQIPESLSLDLVARRPDLRAQIYRAHAASYLVGARQADFYPNVDLSAFIGFETITSGSLLSKQSGLTSIAPAVHLPLFTGGRIQAQVDEARALYDQAIFDYNDTLLQAVREVADELTLFHGIHQQIHFIATAKEMLEHKKMLEQERYDTGINSYFSVLRSREELTQIEMNLVELRYMRQMSAIRLIRALGGGYHEPLQVMP